MQMRQNINRQQASIMSSPKSADNKDQYGIHSENKLERMMLKQRVTKLRSYVSLFLVILFAMSTNIVRAQQTEGDVQSKIKIKGIVRDVISKQPIAAARVAIQNSIVVSTTNDDGEFEIQLSNGYEVLVVSAYDYNVRDVSVGGRTNLEIDLYSDVFKANYENVEGLTGPRRNTYNTLASKQIEEIELMGNATIDNPIQNNLGGDVRSIQRSGLTGIGNSYFIRGLNSLNINAQPLFVVDGVVWNSFYDVRTIQEGYFMNSLAYIDLNDIETVSVIKDGTSLYGSKGANGVIVINTKRGQGKATKITLNASNGVSQSPASIPTMDGDQYRIYMTDLLGSLNETIDPVDYEFLNDDPSERSYPRYHNKTNWNKRLYQASTSQYYSIGVNGGDDKALYNFSAGYYGDKGVVKTSNYSRLNTRFNADISMTEDINMGLNLGFTNITRTLLDDGVNYYTSPRFLGHIKSPFLNPYIFTTAGTESTDFEDSDLFGVGNPLAIINNSLNTSKQSRFNIGAIPEYRINKKYTLSSHFEYTFDKIGETNYSPIIGVEERPVGSSGVSENRFQGQQMRNINIFDDTRLSYTNTYDNEHHVKAVLGWRYISNYFESDFAEGHNSGTDQKRNLYSDEEFKATAGVNDRVKSISNYLNIDYNYLNKYFLTFASSMDASSRFGRETKGGIQLFGRSWGLFPSINAAWLASSEEFMTKYDFVDRLKVRFSAGTAGNDDLSPYAWTTYFTSTQYIDRGNGLVIGNIGNSELQWENSFKLNLGVDANLYNDVLAITFDVYNSRTYKLISLHQLPEIAGGGYFLANEGAINNLGFELSANAKVVNTPKWKWDVTASLGHYTNRIISLPNGDYTTPVYKGEILTAEGHSAGVFYGYKSLGVFSSEAEASAANLKIVSEKGIESFFKAGDVHFDDVNKDGIIDENDKQIIGDPNPLLYGIIANNVAYGNFSLNAFFNFSVGNDVYNYFRQELESGSEFHNQSTAMLQRWTHEGQQTSIPQATFGDKMGNSRFSDRWIEDASFLKLKSLKLNYKFNLNNEIIRGLNISLSVNNLFTISNYLGLDPEVSSSNSVLLQGIDTGLLPSYRSYLIGIKLNL